MDLNIFIKGMRNTFFLIILVICLFLVGCGYYLLKGNNLKNSTYSIAITPILNRTTRPDLDWKVMDCIVKELTNWPGIKIIPYEEADYYISAEILSYQSQIPYTYDDIQNPVEFKISLLTSFSLKKRQSLLIDANVAKDISEEIIHIIPNLRQEEIYRITTSNLAENKLTEWEALERAMKRIIRMVMDQFMSTVNLHDLQ